MVGPMVLLGVLVGIVFLFVALVLAPLKLYGIHRELRITNATLAEQNKILTAIATEMHFDASSVNAAILPAPMAPR